MRVLALSMILFATGCFPVQAQTYDPRYPVCMKIYDGSFGGGERIDCGFTSLPQCQASASGRAAMCVTNPYFGHRPAASSRRQRVY